jgi:hypothetical protein
LGLDDGHTDIYSLAFFFLGGTMVYFFGLVLMISNAFGNTCGSEIIIPYQMGYSKDSSEAARQQALSYCYGAFKSTIQNCRSQGYSANYISPVQCLINRQGWAGGGMNKYWVEVKPLNNWVQCCRY